jgi:hypothetical protein
MIERDNYPQEEEPIPGQSDQELNDVNASSLEEQEQINTSNLTQRVEEENQPSDDYGDANETLDQASQGEEDLSSFLDRSLPGAEESRAIGSDKPVTKNLLGDNPPGSEQAAFDAGNVGDMTADQAKYLENTVEGLRENIEKTQSQLDLDKRLREDSSEE